MRCICLGATAMPRAPAGPRVPQWPGNSLDSARVVALGAPRRGTPPSPACPCITAPLLRCIGRPCRPALAPRGRSATICRAEMSPEERDAAAEVSCGCRGAVAAAPPAANNVRALLVGTAWLLPGAPVGSIFLGSSRSLPLPATCLRHSHPLLCLFACPPLLPPQAQAPHWFTRPGVPPSSSNGSSGAGGIGSTGWASAADLHMDAEQPFVFSPDLDFPPVVSARARSGGLSVRVSARQHCRKGSVCLA